MESEKNLMKREAKKCFDSVLGNNRTSGWQVSLLRIRISDDGLQEHMDIISGKLEDNGFAMN